MVLVGAFLLHGPVRDRAEADHDRDQEDYCGRDAAGAGENGGRTLPSFDR